MIMNHLKKTRKFYDKHQLKVLAILLGITILGMYLFSLEHESQPQDNYILENASAHGCEIEYSETECVNGRLKTAFYNPNNQKITYVKVSVPVNSGTNLYNVDDPLPPKEIGRLTTAKCKDKRQEDLLLKWCCKEKCFKMEMTNPSEDLTLEY